MGNVSWFTYECIFGSVHHLKAIEFINEKENQRLEGFYRALPNVRAEVSPDVSSAIGRFLTTSEISLADNERLERCLADLLMNNMHRYLREEGPVLLVEGPPLSKLIGRIGYRYPRPEVTIAFVTIRPEYLPQPGGASVMSDGWNGPFPGLQEDTVRRTYFRYKPIPIRLDIFAQGLQRFRPLCKKGGVPMGVTAKLRAISEDVLKFADYLNQREAQSQPRYIAGQPKRFTPVADEGTINENLAEAARGGKADASSKKREPRTPNRSTDPSVERGKRDLVRALTSVPEDAILDTIFDKTDRHIRKANGDLVKQFLAERGLGTIDEKQNKQLLIFVQKRIIEERKERPYRLTVQDLERWYAEFKGDEGRS